MLTVHTQSPEDTRAFGALVGASLRPGTVVTIDAPLGLGKTCLAKGIAHGFGGVDPDGVTSPAFTLVNEYVGEDGMPALYHMDFYRLDDLGTVDEQMVDEYLRDEQAVVLMEWGGRFVGRFVTDYLKIVIDFCGAEPTDCREIVVKPHGGDFGELLERVESSAGSDG